MPGLAVVVVVVLLVVSSVVVAIAAVVVLVQPGRHAETGECSDSEAYKHLR